MNRLFLFLILSISPFILQAQNGYVHASGNQIVDGNGRNLLLKGIGTGNWMLQEGYMMQTSDVAGTQWEFKKKLIATIGIDKTNQFYTAWLDNHFRRIDVDSMAHWGFNCVRPALHYKLFTLPIEDEPVQGVNTWLDGGFARLDSLMAWCAANRMYVMLDMHAAPGGQGKDASISDYDPSKSSLWESEANKSKYVALWRKIAERYASNKWIAGYDLLNETNWTFPEGNNSQLRALYGRVTSAIREVDPNHMIVIEGNWFANDYSGLTPAWDTNMAYSFHKYWTNNDAGVIKWVLDLRNNTNCPIWLGESGENSNRWFTDCIALMEKNNIGWSFWPVKKPGINNILKVTTNADYTNLINYWNGNAPKPTVDQAFQAVMKFADNQKLENCTIQHDVIDAMIRQPQTTETLPYKANTTSNTIYGVDYDYGQAGYAYSDSLDADYHLSNTNYTAWNNGWAYRSDGVDIGTCNDDAATNGYCVQWVETGDWMQYTIQSAEAMAYNLLFRYAGESRQAKVYVEVNGRRASKSIALTPTGSWSTWRTVAITNVIIPRGNVKIKIIFENGGANFNYFQLRNPKAIENTTFEVLNAETDKLENTIYLKLNKPADTLIGNPFSVSIDGKEATILSSEISATDNQTIILKTSEDILYGSVLKVNYTGTGCMTGTQNLAALADANVQNLTLQQQSIPGRIEAENFINNNGFSLETCTDTGGGQDLSYSAKDMYADYFVYVQNSGDYKLDFRVSVNSTSAQIALLKDQNGSMIPVKTISFTQTGGWQKWQTQSTTVFLTAGKNILRLLSRTDGYNLNWFQFSQPTPVNRPTADNFSLYPNPAHDYLFLKFSDEQLRSIELIDLQGRVLSQIHSRELKTEINTKDLNKGIYIVKIVTSENAITQKLQIQ
ncbi:MAG: carbohydrate-binding protein [Bacteroidota bacterium]|nr:carbohydrate-binding protein [Bacteroidota bacterium]